MILVLMGVSGSGKSTVGEALARSLKWPFLEGDDDHPSANREKMARGIPLTEEDRRPWLDRLGARIESVVKLEGAAVVACSALRRGYRDRLSRFAGEEGIRFVLLDGPEALIRERLQRRKGHFAGTELLESQRATLERPSDALEVGIEPSVSEIVAQIRTGLSI